MVEAVGNQVSAHRTDDQIEFINPIQSKDRTWAKFVEIKADAHIVSIPSYMDFRDAAAVPVAGGTVLRPMHGLPKFSQGDSWFIVGGSCSMRQLH